MDIVPFFFLQENSHVKEKNNLLWRVYFPNLFHFHTSGIQKLNHIIVDWEDEKESKEILTACIWQLVRRAANSKTPKPFSLSTRNILQRWGKDTDLMPFLLQFLILIHDVGLPCKLEDHDWKGSVLAVIARYLLHLLNIHKSVGPHGLHIRVHPIPP